MPVSEPLLKGERKKFLKNCKLISYAIIFVQITFFYHRTCFPRKK